MAHRCFAAFGSEQFAFAEETMNTNIYQNILKKSNDIIRQTGKLGQGHMRKKTQKVLSYSMKPDEQTQKVCRLSLELTKPDRVNLV